MSHTLDTPLNELQLEIQRKFGRNILRLQEYELLAKRLLAHHKLTGTPTEWTGNLAKRKSEISTKTLGQVIGEMTGSYLVPSSVDSGKSNEDDVGGVPAGGDWFSIQRQVIFDDDRYETLKRELGELVELRNDLVHHFLERYDCGCEDGCRQGDAYLDEGYARIDNQFRTLLSWCDSFDAVSKMAASIDSSPALEDFLVHGISPGGQVLWPISTIVEVLREAEQRCRQDKGTLLTDAITYLARYHPEHTPTRYHCKSWRQVLRKSRLFDFWKEADHRGGMQTWYRSKQPRPDAQSSST